VNVCVVSPREFAEEEKIVNDPDEGAKYHSAQACYDPYQQ
jgi:hypothetical protein